MNSSSILGPIDSKCQSPYPDNSSLIKIFMQLKFSRIFTSPSHLDASAFSRHSIPTSSCSFWYSLCPVSLRDGAGERIVQLNADLLRDSGTHTAHKSLEALDYIL